MQVPGHVRAEVLTRTWPVAAAFGSVADVEVVLRGLRLRKAEVRATVSRFCSSGSGQSDGTWIDRASGTSGLPTVVLDSHAYVVTAY